MNITMYDGQESEPAVENYYIEVPIGATGAVGTIVRQRGFSDSIACVRSAVGTYVFTLKDGVNAIIDWSFDIQTNLAGSTTAGIGSWPRIIARTQNSITIVCINNGGTAVADPQSGDTIIGVVTGKNSNA